MKIKAISEALMSLVSALAFIMLSAQQSKACPPCPPNQECITQWNICVGISAVPPRDAKIVDPNTHTFDPNTETCVAIANSDKVGCATKQ
jgi:hypothetical protein